MNEAEYIFHDLKEEDYREEKSKDTKPLKFERNFFVKFEFLFFLKLLYSFKIKGGCWYILVIIYLLRIGLTLIAAGLDIAIIIIYNIFLKLVFWLLKGALEIVKSILLSIVKVVIEKVGGRLLGILTFFVALFIIFTIYDTGAWSKLYLKLSDLLQSLLSFL